MPIGTVRSWSQGDVIKAHAAIPPFSNGWISLKTSPRLESIGRDCDRYASHIADIKMPINGQKFLDHEIDSFGESIGEEKFFTADNFKQYYGFHGAGRYSFRNQFSKLFMNNDMNLSEIINEELVEENKASGGSSTEDVLTPAQKKEIRDRVRREYKERGSLITEDRALQLLEIVKRTREQVMEGLDFKDPNKKKIYEDFKVIADLLPERYELIKEKRKQKIEAINLIEDTFQDNWGVRESCKDYIQKKFDEYVRKYSEQISKDSLQEQIDEFGVNIEMSPDEFYSKIYEKAKEQNYDFLENFVGKEITITNGGGGNSRRVKVLKGEVKPIGETFYYEGEFGSKIPLIDQLKNGLIKLAPEYNELGSNFKDLIYLRFLKRYNKSVEGDWSLEHLPAIQNLENIILELPEGHFLTNDQLNLITNKTYKGGNNGGYAWYSSGEKRINLSASCIERSTIWGTLSNPTEFKSVMLHEIGHAVDKKLGSDGYYDYRKFVVECGWTYQSPELRAGMSATGDDKSLPRTGSNSQIKLITNYSGKSPSEAFAEYYSFYNLNKKSFDKFFETGDRKYLQEKSKTIADGVSSEREIRDLFSHRSTIQNVESVTKYRGILRDLERELSDRGGETKIVLTSPWEISFSQEEKKNLKPEVVRQRKDYSIHSMPPIIVVKDGLSRVAIDGGTRVEVARMNKKMVPSIEVPKEMYTKLKEKGYDDSEISNIIIIKHDRDYVPKQIAPSKTITGLVYRDELIPLDVILQNADGIKTMKKICGSKALEKALGDIFEK